MGLNGLLLFIVVLYMPFVSTSHPTTVESNVEDIHKQYSETKNVYCKCENGYCELNHAGQIVCMCPVEYGPVTPTKCKRCDCGRGANCTFDWGLFRDTKYCLCKRGYKDVNGRCRGDCSGTPCQNGGICRIKGYDIACDCKKPYYGELCQMHDTQSSTPISKSLIIITCVSVGFLIMCCCVICCRCFRGNRENKTVVRRTVQPPPSNQNFNAQYQEFDLQQMSQFPPPPPPYTEQDHHPTTNMEIAPPTAPPMYESY